MRRALLIVLMATFAVRSLLPVGFMLQSVDGYFEVAICTESGLQRIILDANGEQVPVQPDGSVSDKCPFALAGSPLIAASQAPSLPTTVRYAAVAYRVAVDLFAADPKPHELSARGPPSVQA